MRTWNRLVGNRWERCAWVLAALGGLGVIGCGGPGTDVGSGGSGGSGGEGGSGGASGGNGGGGGSPAKEEPDYALAFPQDEVPRLDITISPESWKAIVDDMTDMLGEFGSGGGMGPGGPGGPGGEPPAELIAACDGLAVGDACEASFMGIQITGTCTSFEGDVVCMPAGGPGGGGMGGVPADGVDLVPRTPIYVECDVATKDRQWHHVGIRLKGNSSLAMPWQQGVWKLPLRLSFDRFEDTYPETEDQRFYGFKSLSLSNGSMDGSLLRDKIGTEVFVRAGIPAPATAFYRVFIDHGDGVTYFGLYTAVEVPSDNAFLDTHFGDHEGNLYKPDGAGARWDTWDPDTLGKENNEAAADFSDAQALFDALHADKTDAEAWRAGLTSRIDADGFLHWLALNTVIQDWDQYGRMPHNYYLYSDPAEGGRFTWIPWDHSFAFSSQNGALSLGMTEVTDQWPLIRYLLDDPHYLEVYRGHVAKAAAEPGPS